MVLAPNRGDPISGNPDRIVKSAEIHPSSTSGSWVEEAGQLTTDGYSRCAESRCRLWPSLAGLSERTRDSVSSGQPSGAAVPLTHVLKCGPRSWRTKVHTDLRAEEATK